MHTYNYKLSFFIIITDCYGRKLDYIIEFKEKYTNIHNTQLYIIISMNLYIIINI